MKKESVFLSKSVSFAIEMVRACLYHTPTNVRLSGLWMQMNMGTDVMGNETHGSRLITFAILIHPGIRVSVNCHVNCLNGEWVSGDTEIWLLDSEGKQNEDMRWKFCCMLKDGQIEVNPVE